MNNSNIHPIFRKNRQKMEFFKKKVLILQNDIWPVYFR